MEWCHGQQLHIWKRLNKFAASFGKPSDHFLNPSLGTWKARYLLAPNAFSSQWERSVWKDPSMAGEAEGAVPLLAPTAGISGGGRTLFFALAE